MLPPTREYRWDLQLIGFPPAMRDSTLSKLPSGVVQDATKEYLEVFSTLPPGVAPMFIGRAETGKTRAAAVVALAFHRDLLGSLDQYPVGVEWVNCPAQMHALERTKFAEESNVIIRRWKKIPVLILDDFLLAPPHLIPELVWAREAAQLPTILTGNVSAEPGRELEEVAKAYGPAGPGILHRLKMLSGGFGVFAS